MPPDELVLESGIPGGDAGAGERRHNRIDRLAARGCVQRHPAPSDRRGVLVRLTDSGRDAVGAALADLFGREQNLLGDLSASETEVPARLLRSVVQPFDG